MISNKDSNISELLDLRTLMKMRYDRNQAAFSPPLLLVTLSQEPSSTNTTIRHLKKLRSHNQYDRLFPFGFSSTQSKPKTHTKIITFLKTKKKEEETKIWDIETNDRFEEDFH